MVEQAGFQTVLVEALDRIRRHHSAFGDRFPLVGEETRYQLTGNNHWLAGFWTGLLWLAYAASGDEDLRAHAESLLPTFRERLERRVHITHDLGFLFTLSARAQWQLTGARKARDLALRAARDLEQRYRPAGRYIQAWGEVGDTEEGGRTIIDTMMNLPILFWASGQTGDARYRKAALAHAETGRRTLLRPDGASYHTFFFDQASGEPLGPRTHQGYADDSLWSRGQAWAIFGFAAAAEWSGEQRFVDASRQAARRFMAELPPDGVPTWDLRLPHDAPHYRDSSAGAIAASGTLRLARLVDGAERDEFHRSALALLTALVTNCFETKPDAQGLLRDGTYHAHKSWGLETYFICGDYFFLEALLALEGKAPDFWGPGESVPANCRSGTCSSRTSPSTRNRSGPRAWDNRGEP
jgi:unsaturated chondroitin disaccharide hydrolase